VKVVQRQVAAIADQAANLTSESASWLLHTKHIKQHICTYLVRVQRTVQTVSTLLQSERWSQAWIPWIAKYELLNTRARNT